MEQHFIITKKYLFVNSILILLSILFLLSSCHNIRYTTKYLDIEEDIIKISNDNNNSNFIKVEYLNDNISVQKTYTKDSILIAYEKFHENKNKRFDESERYFGYKKSIGESRFWYPNGSLKSVINYNDEGIIDGELQTYYENGKLKRHDYIDDGKLVSGKCFDINGKEIEYIQYFSEPLCELDSLKSALNYPEDLRRANIEEIVWIKILIDSTGMPVRIMYDKRNSIQFVREIIRVFKNYKLFAPAILEGNPISVWCIMPISFRLI